LRASLKKLRSSVPNPENPSRAEPIMSEMPPPPPGTPEKKKKTGEGSTNARNCMTTPCKKYKTRRNGEGYEEWSASKLTFGEVYVCEFYKNRPANDLPPESPRGDRLYLPRRSPRISSKIRKQLSF
jgi:hypothetical protein